MFYALLDTGKIERFEAQSAPPPRMIYTFTDETLRELIQDCRKALGLKLPVCCAAIHPTEPCLVTLLSRGEKGYWLFRTCSTTLAAEALVKDLNDGWGVTDIQAEAMLAGSLWGFDVPGADPEVLERMRQGKGVKT